MDSVWDNLETETKVEDKNSCYEALPVKTEKLSPTKATAIKRSKTIPLITPSTPIVPHNCNEAEETLLNEGHRPKKSIRRPYTKKPKMCTVCGEWFELSCAL